MQHRAIIAVALALLLASCTTVRDTRDLSSDYEGLYRNEDNTTLLIAARPQDHALFAVIDGARYPLQPARQDVFLDATGNEVHFIRDETNSVIGYRVGPPAHVAQAPLHARLNASARLPANAWRARRPSDPIVYRYAAPAQIGDGINARSLPASSELRSHLETLTNAVLEEEFPNLHSVLVYDHGALVFERYFYEFDRATTHQMRSATKTLIALLVGAAMDRGLIASLDAPVIPYFSEYADLQNLDDGKRSITIRNLLSMQSGLACDDWNQDSPGNESRMYETDDWARFILDLPMASAPGVRGSYCSGNVILVGRIIEKVTARPLRDFADEVLFAPLGITDYEWDFRPDRSNIDNFAQAHLRPRDMMKIGVLLLDRGAWQRRQIISSAWIDELTAQHSEIQDTPYGYFWWRRYLDLPSGRVETPQASGNGGQKIIVLRDSDTVVVLTGGNYNADSDTNRILADFILPHNSELGQ